MQEISHICHITAVHTRYDRRIFEKECVSLAKNGYSVTLLVNDGKPAELKNGVSIISIHGKRFEGRLARILFSSRLFYREALRTHAVVFHLHDPELLPLARKLLRRQKKVIFDSHEDVPKQILGKSYIPARLRPFISYVYKKYEEKTLAKVNGVIIVTPGQRGRIEKVQTNVEMVTNFPSREELVCQETIQYPRKVQVCFAGGIDRQWCHEKVLGAIAGIDNLLYCIAGDKDQDPLYWKYLVNCNRWKGKLKYMGILQHKEIPKLYNESICGMALLNYSSPCGKEGTLGNTKLFEYMKYGIPVICSDMRLWRLIIDKYKCGICVDPNDEDEIRDAILYLLNNPLRAREIGSNGIRAIYKEFNWESQIKALLSLYGRI